MSGCKVFDFFMFFKKILICKRIFKGGKLLVVREIFFFHFLGSIHTRVYVFNYSTFFFKQNVFFFLSTLFVLFWQFWQMCFGHRHLYLPLLDICGFGGFTNSKRIFESQLFCSLNDTNSLKLGYTPCCTGTCLNPAVFIAPELQIKHIPGPELLMTFQHSMMIQMTIPDVLMMSCTLQAEADGPHHQKIF